METEKTVNGAGGTIAWTDHWRVLFGFEPDQQETDSLVSWLNMQFPPRGVDRGWTKEELISALNDYAERFRKRRDQEGKNADGRIRPPTGPQIKSRIIAARHEARHAAAGPEENGKCCLCNGKGWITFYHDCGDDDVPEDFAERFSLRCASIPCVCAAGDAVMRRPGTYSKLAGSNLDRFTANRWKAAKQNRALLSAYEQER